MASIFGCLCCVTLLSRVPFPSIHCYFLWDFSLVTGQTWILIFSATLKALSSFCIFFVSQFFPLIILLEANHQVFFSNLWDPFWKPVFGPNVCSLFDDQFYKLSLSRLRDGWRQWRVFCLVIWTSPLLDVSTLSLEGKGKQQSLKCLMWGIGFLMFSWQTWKLFNFNPRKELVFCVCMYEHLHMYIHIHMHVLGFKIEVYFYVERNLDFECKT